MGKTPRKHSVEFKAKVAIDLIREHEPLTQICSKYGIHPTQARRWRDEALAGFSQTFQTKPNTAVTDQQRLIDELYKRIGELNVQLDWVKKKTGLTPSL